MACHSLLSVFFDLQASLLIVQSAAAAATQTFAQSSIAVVRSRGQRAECSHSVTDSFSTGEAGPRNCSKLSPCLTIYRRCNYRQRRSSRAQECREGRSLVLTLGFNRIISIDLQEAYCILECSSGINSSACNDRQNGAARESSTLVYPLVRINVLPRLFCR